MFGFNKDDEMALVDYGMVISLMFFFRYCIIFYVMIFVHFFLSLCICVVMDILKIISLFEYLPPKALISSTKCQ